MPRLAATYVELALDGAAEDAVQTAVGPLLRQELDLAALYDDVLAPAAIRIGDLWHSGQITVADEHYVTRLTLDAMSVARGTLALPARPRGPRVVLACGPGEQHDLPLRMLADVLRSEGYDARLLGAETPVRDLVAYVEKVGADAVGLTASSALAIPGIVQAVEALRALDPAPPIFLGGRCLEHYPAVAGATGVDAVCTRLAAAPELLAGLLAG